MSETIQDHPDSADLMAFGLGRLDGPRLAAVEEHVAACDSCCEALNRSPEDTLVHKIREAATDAPLVAAATMPATGINSRETAAYSAAPGSTEQAPEAPDELLRHTRYRILNLLGRGGMGAVYLAEHGVMRRLVALKVIKPDYTANPAAVERFQREIRAAAQLHHPNIVVAYDAERAGDTHFLVMEYIEGVSLDRLIAERGPLPVAEACAYVRQAALGLQHAHEQGMVHRDVKPHNLIRGANGVVKVLDFGLASVSECGVGQLTGTNMVMGTPDYIAPEQAEDTHAADARADIYSLGCTLYHLLSGRPPFARPSVLLTLRAHREENPKPLSPNHPDIPTRLVSVIRRMMAKAPTDRYQTADEVAAALATFANAQPFDATVVQEPDPARRRSLRSMLGAIAVVAVCAAVLAAVAAAVVVHIQTEQGEVTIQTDDPHIEVVVTKGGKLVRIVDPQSKQTWQLDPEKFELSMAEQPDGLTISLDGKTPFTLKRKGEKLVTIVRGQATSDDKVSEVRRFLGHSDLIDAVAYSPNGRTILTGARVYGEKISPCDVQLWDAASGNEIRRFKGHRSSVSCVAFSPDGKRVAAGAFYTDPTIYVWDVASGEVLRHFMLDATHPAAYVCGVAFSKDGRNVFSCGADPRLHGRTLRMWDVDTGKEVHRFDECAAIVRCLAVSHDGRFLVSCSLNDDDAIRLWDIESGKEVRCFHKRTKEEQDGVAFSPDDARIVTAGDEGNITLWDVQRGEEIRRFLGHDGKVAGVDYSPDGRRILSAGFDRTARLWDVDTGKELYRFTEHTAWVMGVAFSPDGRFALSGSHDNTARIWHLPEPAPPTDKPGDAP